MGVALFIACGAPLGLGRGGGPPGGGGGGAVLLLRRRAARLRRALGVFAIVVALAAGGEVAVLLARGTAESGIAGLRDGDLTVLVWNTQGGATSPAEVAELVLAAHADLVSLPEMDDDAAAEVARRVSAGGIPMTAVTTRAVADSSEPSWIPTSLLVADRLGAYRLDACRAGCGARRTDPARSSSPPTPRHR